MSTVDKPCVRLYFDQYYGDSFKIECPTGSGNMMNLFAEKQLAEMHFP